MAGPKIRASTTDQALARLIDCFAPDSLDITKAYTLSAFHKACQAEGAGLPDPYQEDPEPFFSWEADDVNKEVWLRPRTTSVRTKFVVRACEECFGINREELRRWRWTLAYDPLRTLKEILDGMQASGKTSRARTLTEKGIVAWMSDGRPYAAMARYFVRQVWKLEL